MLTAKRLAGVAPEVNLIECKSHLPCNAIRAIVKQETSLEIQNRGTSGTQSECVRPPPPKKNLNKKKKRIVQEGVQLNIRAVQYPCTQHSNTSPHVNTLKLKHRDNGRTCRQLFGLKSYVMICLFTCGNVLV